MTLAPRNLLDSQEVASTQQEKSSEPPAYSAPRLRRLGDVRAMTLATGSGTKDSTTLGLVG